MKPDAGDAPFIRSRSAVESRLAARLVGEALLTPSEMEDCRRRAAWAGLPLDQWLIRDGRVPADRLIALLASACGWPVLRMSEFKPDPAALDLLPVAAALKFRMIPVKADAAGALLVATDHAPEDAEEEQLRVMLGRPIHWRLCAPDELTECFKHHYGLGADILLKMQSAAGRKGGRRADDSEEGAEDMPAFVGEILADAIRSGATDIHIEPEEGGLRLRYRIDGVLSVIPLPKGIENYTRPLVSAIKIMASLNIAERRLPQDGRIEWKAGGDSFDLRVSVLPTRHGEAVNLRILNRRSTFMRLSDLGFRADQYDTLVDLAGQPYGMILFTGPTGSGKTTSLYAALAHLNDTERKIVTIEDPVEYQMAGITQLQVQPSIGFTFAAGLRAILRHDPDVVLIGEIRDGETAGIAVSAALTGHLVFSTLHTNDSAGSLTRLVDMGIEPYLVASSVHGIVAQRLVRRLCPQCAEPEPLTGRMREELDALKPGGAETGRIRRGRGCPRCRFTGYSGRRPIFEIVEMTDDLRALVVERASSAVLMQHAVSRGLVTLRRAAWDLVLDGETSVEELLRVTRRTRAADAPA